MKVDALTPVLRAAPGERARCRLRIENDDAGPLSYGLRVVGFDENHVLRPAPNGPIAAGTAEEVELEFLIPDAFAAGHHSIGVEVTSARPGSAPVIAGITVSVGQIDDVAMAVVPSTVRGRRRGKFRLDLDNRSWDTIDVELGGEGPDLRVTLRPDRVELRPGDRIRTSGKVKGPRHLVGDPLQHSFTVTARSKSAPSYAPGTFHQRSLLPRSLRTLLAALLLVGIWAGVLGAGVYWWMERDEGGPTANLVQLVDTDGDGVADTPADQLIDTDGDGVPDTLASVVAAEVAAGGGGEPQAGGSGLPTRTVVGGTVKAGETGDDADVRVTLSPIDLATTPEGADLPTPAGESRGFTSLPEQTPPEQAPPTDQPGVSSARQTVSVESTATGPDGAWLFADVPIRQTYELNFALEGFDSQSFVITPPDDGSPVEMEVVLEPASGGLSGSVVGPGGPLGNVDLVLTDGELTFNTTTASAGDVGTWSLSGVSTPGTYTLTATLRGYGTEVLSITLEPGEQRSGVTISMVPDVGSIIGRVSADGDALGGVTLTASSGDDTRTTTSLTEGDTGLYSFPRLGTPGRYTVTASRDGYVTQTRLVTLGGNVTGVDFNLVRTTATIRGVMTSVARDGAGRGRLAGAAITVSRDELSFDTESASPPDENVGSFVITDLPPGTYLVGFSRFDHRPVSRLVTVAAGEVKNLGKIPLRFAPRRGVDQLGSLEVRVVDEGGDPLLGSTVAVRDVATGEVVASMSDEGVDRQSTFVFDPLDVGTYEVTGTKPQFKPRTARVSIGPKRRESIQLILFEQGQATGRIVDSLSDPDDPTPLTGYFVTIHTVLTNGDRGPAFLPPISPNPPDDDGNIVWETPPRSLPIGRYEVVVTQPPPGYRVRPDQVLMDGLPPMRFDILPEGQDVLVLADIEADPLPELTGRVLAPRLGAPNNVTFVAINSESLTVGLTCTGGPGRSEGRVDLDGLPGFDAFEFPKETVAQAIGTADGANCTLTFEADEYVPVTVPVRIDPSDGVRDPDITRNVAMFKPTDIGGSTYWVDHGNGDQQMPAPAIEITSTGQVITGFNPSTGADDPQFVVSPGPVSTSADAGGLWAFGTPRQVFGRMTYDIADPGGNYDSRQITVTIDENGRTVAPDDTLDIELDAHGGFIDGTIQIRSVTPDFTGFVMELTGAADITIPAVATAPGSTIGLARATTTDPGTYQAAITIPDHHVSFDGLPQSGIPLFQNPGQNIGFSRDYVELGRVDVTVVDGLGAPVSGATVTLEHVPSIFIPGDPVVGPIAPQPTVAGQVSFDDLPVNTVSPEGLPVTYVARVTAAPGHDVTNASATVQVVAGGAPAVTITIPEYGSITGNVVGRIPGQPDAALPIGDPLVIEAVRVGADGLPVGEPALPVDEDPDGVGFSVSGPPGLYTINVSHPAFEPFDPPIVPPPDEIVNGVPVFRMTNITTGNETPNDAGEWVLRAPAGHPRPHGAPEHPHRGGRGAGDGHPHRADVVHRPDRCERAARGAEPPAGRLRAHHP